MNAEELLERLFDFQQFEKNEALQSVIDEVEGRYFRTELSEEELELFSAAGDPYLQAVDPKKGNLPL